MIELQGLTVTYGRTVALDKLQLTLGEGVTGLFGPNGSGKSTLLRALAGLVRPTSGRVLLGGVPVLSTDEGFRARVGYAGHETGLYPRLTVHENLALFARLHSATETGIDDLLERLGLTARRDTPVSELSAGFKRRAAMARAMVHEPDVLLLDEPYANLDDEAAELVGGAVVAWRNPQRVGVIASHGAKRVKGYADASLVLRRGLAVSYRRRVQR